MKLFADSKLRGCSICGLPEANRLEEKKKEDPPPKPDGDQSYIG